jgi:hypothetical protein
VEPAALLIPRRSLAIAPSSRSPAPPHPPRCASPHSLAAAAPHHSAPPPQGGPMSVCCGESSVSICRISATVALPFPPRQAAADSVAVAPPPPRRHYGHHKTPRPLLGKPMLALPSLLSTSIHRPSRPPAAGKAEGCGRPHARPWRRLQ